MRIFRALKWKVLIFLAVLAAANLVLSYALIPATSDSTEMWKRFDEEPEIDTVFVGSSLCTYGINPFAYDVAMRTHSFNMGSPSQMLSSSYIAIETAIRKKGVKTVIYPLWYETLQSYQNNQAEVSFLQARNHIGSIAGNLNRYRMFVQDRHHFDTAASLNIAFPWVNDHVQIEKSVIENNIKKKRNPEDTTIIVENPGEEVEDLFNLVTEEDKVYIGHGFTARRGIVDYNLVGHMDLTHNTEKEFDTESMEDLAKICKLCKDNGVDLVVIKTPMAAFDVLGRQDTYFDKMEELSAFLEEQGIEYYDFNLVKPEFFKSYEFYYLDLSQHLNFVGATKFSEALGKFMQRRKDGGTEDLSDLFYTKEEYLESIDYISAVDFTSHYDGVDLVIDASALTGTKTQVEYRYSYRPAANEDLVELHPFTSDSTYTWYNAKDLLAEGATIYVEARVKGRGDATYRHFENIPGGD